jgi:hypothetical protein
MKQISIWEEFIPIYGRSACNLIMQCLSCTSTSARLHEVGNRTRVFCGMPCQKAYYRIGLKDKDAGVDDEDIIGIETAETHKFRIKRKVAVQMLTLKHLLEDASSDDYIQLPNVYYEPFAFLLRFLDENTGQEVDPKIHPTFLSDRRYFEVFMAANYLDFQYVIGKHLIHQLYNRLILDDDWDRTNLCSRLHDLRGYLRPAINFVPSNRLDDVLAFLRKNVYAKDIGASTRQTISDAIEDVYKAWNQRDRKNS